MRSILLRGTYKEASLPLHALDMVVQYRVEKLFKLKRANTIDMCLIKGIEEVEIGNMCSTRLLKRCLKV